MAEEQCSGAAVKFPNVVAAGFDLFRTPENHGTKLSVSVATAGQPQIRRFKAINPNHRLSMSHFDISDIRSQTETYGLGETL
jgi:hypothetical protein